MHSIQSYKQTIALYLDPSWNSFIPSACDFHTPNLKVVSRSSLSIFVSLQVPRISINSELRLLHALAWNPATMRPVISKPIECCIRAIRFGNGDSGSMGICQCLTLSKTLNRVFRVKCHPVADVPNETTFLTKLCHFLQYFPLVIDTFTYGIYSALFVQSTQVLLSRRRVNYKLYLVCLSTLFLLSTIHIVAAYAWAFITDTATTGIYEVLSLRKTPPHLYGADDPMIVHSLVRLIRARYALANALADAILIHRCYIIWGYSWRAVAFPILAYLLNIVGVIIGALPLVGPSERIAISVCIGTTFFTNVVASSLAAGRIWWISRRASCVLSRGSRRRYSNLTAILLESGLIYPASIIVVIGMFVAPETSTVAVLISIAPVYHIVAIAPTLILVRVGLGVSTDDVGHTATTGRERATGPRSSLRFSPREMQLEVRGEESAVTLSNSAKV